MPHNIYSGCKLLVPGFMKDFWYNVFGLLGVLGPQFDAPGDFRYNVFGPLGVPGPQFDSPWWLCHCVSFRFELVNWSFFFGF